MEGLPGNEAPPPPAPGSPPSATGGGGINAYSGWYVASDGQTVGPLDWAAVIELTHHHGLDCTLVWHPSLPAWTPAVAVVPAPVAGPGFAAATASRRHRPAWLWVAGIAGALGLALGLGLGLGLRGHDEVPLVDAQMAAVYPEEPFGETWSATVSPGDAEVVEGDGAVISVPDGSVAGNTVVVLTRVPGPYDGSWFDTAGASGATTGGEEPDVYGLSPVFDVGPAGTEFDKPVEVTIGYDGGAIPEGMSEDDIHMAYFDGRGWVVAPTLVDTEADTATVALGRFDGCLLEVVVAVVVLGPITYYGIKWLYGYEGVETDAITEGRAYEYVTPNDPLVGGWAVDAVLAPADARTDAQGSVSLTDPSAVAAAAGGGMARPRIAYTSASGKLIIPRYSLEPPANWQHPADYFAKNYLKGDCTDMANALVSVLRRLGYNAKGVFGYSVANPACAFPHVWTETVIGGKPYLVDEEGFFWPLTQETLDGLMLKRAAANDPRNAMWDERAQTRYVEKWWEAEAPPSTTTTTSTTAPAGGDDLTGQIPVKPGVTINSVTRAVNPSVPSDIRLYVTTTHDSSIGDRRATAVTVLEYYCPNGVLRTDNPTLVFLTEVSPDSEDPGSTMGAALAHAAEAIARSIAGQGLVESPGSAPAS